jgi:hypothetical protein
MVAAVPPANAHLINIPLIYRKYFAGAGTAGTVDKASATFCQHGTGVQQVAAKTALPTIPLADKQLVLNILLLKMNQPETPCLSGEV